MAKSTKFAATLSNSDIALARKFEAARLTTFSQAVKAFERDDSARIAQWEAELREINTYVTDVAEAEELAYTEDAVRFPAPVVVEAEVEAQPELVTISFQQTDLTVSAATTDEEIAKMVQNSSPAFDQIDTDAIAERALKLSQGRGFLTATNDLLTDVDEIEAYLLGLAHEIQQAKIDATVAGLIAARDAAFAELA